MAAVFETAIFITVSIYLGHIFAKRVFSNVNKIQERYRIITEYSPLSIELYNAYGYLLSANQSCFTMLGIKDISEISTFYLFDDPYISEEHKNDLKAGKTINYDVEIDFDKIKQSRVYSTSKSGKLFVNITMVAIKEDGKNTSGYLRQMRDITERRYFKKAFMESESKYRFLVENSHDILYTLSSDGIFTFVSDSWTVLLGHEVSEVLGQSFQKFIDPEDLPKCFIWIKKFLQTGLRQGSIEYRVKHKNGSWRWHSSNGVPFKDEAGNVIGFEGNAHDITDSKNQEKLLKDTEQQLELAVEGSSVGLWDYRVETKKIFTNHILAAFLGYSPEVQNYSLKEWQELCNKEDVAKTTKLLVQYLRGEKPVFEAELRVKHKMGYWNWILLRGAVNERDKQGRPLRISGTAVNIARLKDSERRQILISKILSILNSSVSYDLAFENIVKSIDNELDIHAIGIRLQNGEDYPFVATKGFSKEFLATENSLVIRDKNGLALKDEKEKTRLSCICGRVLSGDTDSSNPLFTKNGSAWTTHIVLLPEIPELKEPDFKARPCCLEEGFLSFVIVPIRNKDAIIGSLHLSDRRGNRFTEEVIADIEKIGSIIGVWLKRKQVEDKLNVSEAQLRKAEEIGKTGSWEYNLDTFELRWSDEVFRIYERDKALGIPSSFEEEKYYSPEDRKKIMEMVAISTKTGKETRYEFKIDLPGGKSKTISSVCVGKRDTSGKVVKISGIVQDISERKNLEEELNQTRKMEALGSLSAGIAHDFNNILGIVLGFSDITLKMPLKEEGVKDNIMQIKKAAVKAANLTSQLLAFSRKQPVIRKPLALNNSICDIKNMLERIIGENIHFELQLDPELKNILADKGQLDQVLINLVTNSKHAMPKGGKLFIKTENIKLDEKKSKYIPDSIPGDFVCVTVADTGLGMSQEQLKRLFEPFYTTKEFGKGSGLGLSVIYGIAKQQEGWVNVSSIINKGTEFKIYLPVLTGTHVLEIEKESLAALPASF
ncbi:MAG: PAS domain S-box protein, partial [Candidatus Firestonebacteria bacterium]